MMDRMKGLWLRLLRPKAVGLGGRGWSLLLCALFWGGPLAVGLAGLPPDADPSIRVFASVQPIQLFAQRVGGPEVRVDLMVPPGRSPATYEPSPQQIAALAQADLYLRVGVPFETAWMRRIRAANPEMPILDLREGLELRPMDAHPHHHDSAEALDAHVWTSPPLVRHMAERIAEQLSALDPAHAADYRARQQAFDQDLQALDAELRARLQGLEGSAFLVYHPAWGYFADTYGLRQIAVEFEGKEPSARRLAALIEQARALNIQVVVVQPQFDQRAAQRLAQAIDGRVAPVDPLAADYFASLRQLADLIAGAVMPQPLHDAMPAD